jgi:hypothetical protein
VDLSNFMRDIFKEDILDSLRWIDSFFILCGFIFEFNDSS